MNAPISQRPVVTVYTTCAFEGYLDVYVVFRSGVVMYTDDVENVLHALNSSAYEWTPSLFGEQHVRDLFEFIGYFPAPCQEQI